MNKADAVTIVPLTRSERWATRLLRIMGVGGCCATFAVFLPRRAMARAHWSLGLGRLGQFPDVPLTDYLTRYLALTHAYHGARFLVLSTDVRRYRPAIRVAGWGTLVMAIALTGVDRRAPMPPWWTAVEGPGMALVGLTLLGLERRMRLSVAGEDRRAGSPAPARPTPRRRRSGKGLLLLGALAALGLGHCLRGSGREAARESGRDA